MVAFGVSETQGGRDRPAFHRPRFRLFTTGHPWGFSPATEIRAWRIPLTQDSRAVYLLMSASQPKPATRPRGVLCQSAPSSEGELSGRTAYFERPLRTNNAVYRALETLLTSELTLVPNAL